MVEQADELARQGATADELDRALKPTLGMLDQSLRDNGYWLRTVMGQSQADPARLDLARTRDADYRSITLEDINGLDFSDPVTETSQTNITHGICIVSQQCGLTSENNLHYPGYGTCKAGLGSIV